jgi:hypothetical protein
LQDVQDVPELPERDDEYVTILRNANHRLFTIRYGVTAHKAWVSDNTAVGNSNLAMPQEFNTGCPVEFLSYARGRDGEHDGPGARLLLRVIQE